AARAPPRRTVRERTGRPVRGAAARRRRDRLSAVARAAAPGAARHRGPPGGAGPDRRAQPSLAGFGLGPARADPVAGRRARLVEAAAAALQRGAYTVGSLLSR